MPNEPSARPEAGRLARLLTHVAAGTRRCSEHGSGPEVSAQLFAARRLVCDGRSAAVHGRGHQRHRSRHSLHLRHSRAAGFLRASLPARNLSHSRRTGGPGRDAGFAARHQCSHPCHRTSADRSAGAAASRREFAPSARSEARPRSKDGIQTRLVRFRDPAPPGSEPLRFPSGDRDDFCRRAFRT